MVADVFVGLCYNAYGLVINAIQKPVYVKITTIQTAKNVLKQNVLKQNGASKRF